MIIYREYIWEMTYRDKQNRRPLLFRMFLFFYQLYF